MAIPNANMLSFLTSGNATGSDGGASQNDPNSSTGGWRSTTEVSLTIGNLFELYTQAELSSSTRYRCVALVNTHATGVRDAMRLVSREVDALKSGLTVEFGVMTNDTSTVAPVGSDTVAPAGITFRSMFESTDDNESDYDEATAYRIGPLNTDSDNSTDLDFDDSMVLFLYIKVIASGASGAFIDGVDNLIGTRGLGTDTI